METAMLERVNLAITSANLWEELATDWLCLDCELMPWSVKAQVLIRDQYAPVGAAAAAMLNEAIKNLAQTKASGLEIDQLLTHTKQRAAMVQDYAAAYRHYCWPVQTVDDLKLAPFHVLASEGKTYMDKPHDWHMQTISRLSGGIIAATPCHIVDVTDSSSELVATQWWEALTAKGGEGMVVKPLDFVAHGKRGLIQPAVKCRGREYLRIIYGPEYTAEENLKRLRERGLSGKRSLALREFALGVEALERFVRKEPLRRVHECVFGVLAMESEPIDPRL